MLDENPTQSEFLINDKELIFSFLDAFDDDGDSSNITTVVPAVAEPNPRRSYGSSL